jgi:hypothetical protein
MQVRSFLPLLATLAFALTPAFSAELTPAQHAKIEALVDSMSVLGKDTAVVAAVKAQNVKLPDILKGMDNAKWKTLTTESPEVQALSKSPLTHYLRGKMHPTVIELFVSDAEGRKVCFFTKPTSFIHKGKPKHDQAMAGKHWVGDLELDQSTQQMQV